MSHEASYQFGSSRVCGDAQRVQHEHMPCALWPGVGIPGAFWSLFYVSRNVVLGTLFWVSQANFYWNS
jgi:hypothetical protein